MKHAPTAEKRPQRRYAARRSVRPPFPHPVRHRNWLVTPDVDEGPDGAFREVIERIARGAPIRGHAL
jgi:hypothetical protein